MYDVNLDKEINALKLEAVHILDRLLKIPEGYSSTGAHRLVECIVSAALLEVANANKQTSDAIKNTGVSDAFKRDG